MAQVLHKVDVAILGGGISGLAAAWMRQQLGEKVALLEAQPRLGGWIRSQRWHGEVIERGPRTFSAPRTPYLLHWIDQLGLTDQVEATPSIAAWRYLWDGERMVRVPPTWYSLLTEPLLRRCLWEVLREPWHRRPFVEHESIEEWILARFGEHTARLGRAIVQGIWGGDASRLEIASCLPHLLAKEKRDGAILWPRRRSHVQGPDSAPQKGLWRLRGGMESLVTRVTERFSAQDGILSLGTRVVRVTPDAHGWKIQTTNGCLHAEKVISALPPAGLAALEAPWRLHLPAVPSVSLCLHHLYWGFQVDHPPGFGYLTLDPGPEGLLGAVFDSSLSAHPSQKSHLTLMQRVSGGSNASVEEVICLACQQLNVPWPEDYCSTSCEAAVPQYEKGFLEAAQHFERAIQPLPPCLFLGAGWSGVAVEDCVREGLKQSKEWDGSSRRVIVPHRSPFA